MVSQYGAQRPTIIQRANTMPVFVSRFLVGSRSAGSQSSPWISVAGGSVACRPRRLKLRLPTCAAQLTRAFQPGRRQSGSNGLSPCAYRHTTRRQAVSTSGRLGSDDDADPRPPLRRQISTISFRRAVDTTSARRGAAPGVPINTPVAFAQQSWQPRGSDVPRNAWRAGTCRRDADLVALAAPPAVTAAQSHGRRRSPEVVLVRLCRAPKDLATFSAWREHIDHSLRR